MKKLITLFVLFLSIGIANAQGSKPTLAETVNYINEVISGSTGVYYKSGDDYYATITEQIFEKDHVFHKGKGFSGEDHSLTTTCGFKKIPWNSLEIVEIKDAESLKQIIVQFKTSLQNKHTKVWIGIDEDDTDEENSNKFLHFYVIPEKAENVKKALLHLKELSYKKDPFD